MGGGLCFLLGFTTVLNSLFLRLDRSAVAEVYDVVTCYIVVKLDLKLIEELSLEQEVCRSLC